MSDNFETRSNRAWDWVRKKFCRLTWLPQRPKGWIARTKLLRSEERDCLAGVNSKPWNSPWNLQSKHQLAGTWVYPDGVSLKKDDAITGSAHPSQAPTKTTTDASPGWWVGGVWWGEDLSTNGGNDKQELMKQQVKPLDIRRPQVKIQLKVNTETNLIVQIHWSLGLVEIQMPSTEGSRGTSETHSLPNRATVLIWFEIQFKISKHLDAKEASSRRFNQDWQLDAKLHQSR